VKRYRVRVIADAEQDLVDIYNYVAIHDTPESAELVLDSLEAQCLRLAELPLRGHIPPELERVGVMAYREVHFKPYRIIYEVSGQNVFIHGVLDGRRDLQSHLERRLLR
jgi:toxin ParE1/3/4